MKITLTGVFPAPQKEKCVVQSTERSADGSASYFVAWHGYSPFYTREAKDGKVFESYHKAKNYAANELFEDESGFQIVTL